MFSRSTRGGCLAVLLALVPTHLLAAAPPTAEEMWRIIQQQQQELQLLRAQVVKLRAQAEETDQKAEAAVAAVEQGAASGASSLASKTRIGGYGELHYNNLEGTGGAADKTEFDFHRFVLYFNHDFSDSIRLFTELELEHALVEDTANGSGPGEIELEQAYIEFDLNENHRAKGGLFLIPVGILNETHEPNTFYGVERNPVEKDIIPTTWWAGGAGLSGRLGGGFSYDLAVHEGMSVPVTGSSAFKVRNGRQKTAKAEGGDTAATARLKWTGIPGLEVAGTIQHQADIAQGNSADAGSANLVELHTAWQQGPFGLRALWARWNLTGSAPEALGRDEQEGWYIEPSWRFSERFGVFARFNQWDNEAGNGDADNSQKEQVDFGFNWWPHANVVIKADYQKQDNDSGSNQDGFNLGIGYQF